MDNTLQQPTPKTKRPMHPFRSAVLRGLAVVFPPLLTIVIFLWVGGTINDYVLRPVAAGVRDTVAWSIADIRQREDVPADRLVDTAADIDQISDKEGRFYRLPDGQFVPLDVYDLVRREHGEGPLSETAEGIYRRYVELRYLQPFKVIPAFLAVFILILYLLGKFMAAGIGRILVGAFERGILQLPLVRTVYSSVKQVSDFLFSSNEIQFSRVVAVEYPRMGIWSLGFVTSESMVDIRDAAKEPVLAVLIPTSPMPVTGYTVNVKRSEAIDLDLTIDQACQFIISCGVVVPPHQLEEALKAKAAKERPS